VAVGYNRPQSLLRLLQSLEKLRVPDGVEAPLLVSLDGGLPEVVAVAERFEWAHGPKTVRTFVPNLRLRKHILACGDLALENDAGVIVLEDDLVASADLYVYALAALKRYGETPGVGGISLYTHRFVEDSGMTFYALEDGYDAYFVQWPSSWGQLWSASQWRTFKDWYGRESEAGVHPHHGVPEGVCKWSEQSWKKYFLRFLIATDRWFVFPRTALTTNCGEPGTHHAEVLTNMAVPLSYGRDVWRFPDLKTGMHHDAWLEPTPDSLRRRYGVPLPDDLTVDFYGFKTDAELRGGHVLSLREQPRAAQRYPLVHLPLASNLELAGQGEGVFALGPRASVEGVLPARKRQVLRMLNGQMGARVAGKLFADRARLVLERRLRRMLKR